MTSDVFTHPWLSGLFGDDEQAHHLSGATTLVHMLSVEAAYARALGSVGQVSADTADQTAARIIKFQPDMDGLRRGTAQDGVVVPSLIRQLRSTLPEELHPALHTGMTSQDVVDTSLVLSLIPVLDLFEDRIKALMTELDMLRDTYGNRPLIGRTRMQAALPIALAHRIEGWRVPLQSQFDRLGDLRNRVLVLQLGGPVGDGSSFGNQHEAIARDMAARLGLHEPGHAWHTNRDGLCELGAWLVRVTNNLGKLGADMALMAQQGLDEIALRGAGTSSAMPHKNNPILAETLITLARYNAVQLAGLNVAGLHEQERSGSAWALEWMVLPSMIQTTGRALILAQQLCVSIDRLG